MDQNQKLNKPFKAPKIVEPSQSPLQLMFKPSLNSLTFENATLSSKGVSEQPVKKQDESKCQKSQSNYAQSELKEDDEQAIDESHIAKSTTVNQTENSNDDDKEAESHANSADENQSSQNSGCEEGELCYEEKKAIIKNHILHRRKHEKNIVEEKRFKCAYCEKQYNNIKTLNDHISDVHSIEIGFQFLCKYCAKGYKTQEGRNNHEQKLCPNRIDQQKKRKSPYQCQIDNQFSYIMNARNKIIKKN